MSVLNQLLFGVCSKDNNRFQLECLSMCNSIIIWAPLHFTQLDFQSIEYFYESLVRGQNILTSVTLQNEKEMF